MPAVSLRRAVIGFAACWIATSAYADPTELLDIPGNTNGVTPIVGSYQSYTVNFTATGASTEVTFLFRNDPQYTSLDNVSLTLNGGGSNLIQNGGFEGGSAGMQNGVTKPVSWTLVGQQGLTAAGTLTQGTPNAGAVDNPYAGSYYWNDGAVGGFDGIAQTVTTVSGQIYTLTFELGSDTGWSANLVETQVYAGAGLPNGISVTGIPNIDTAAGYYAASGLGSVVNPAFTGGTLRMDSSSTVAQNFTIDNTVGSTIDAYGHNSIFSGVLSNAPSDTGALTITDSVGGGAVIFNGVNTYSGTTTVAGGTFEVGDIDHSSASIAGGVIVDTGGTLRGHGTIGGTVTNSGIVAPGGSIGTTTVNGNYVQNSNGTLSIELNPAVTSKLVVSGAATLAGTLSVTPDSGVYARGTVYQILTAGNGVSGTFSTLSNTDAALAGFGVSYKPDEVDLISTSGTSSLASNSQTVDQNSIARAIDTLAPTVNSGVINNIINALVGMSPTAQAQALDQLTNHVTTRTEFGGSTGLRLLTGSLISRATNTAGVANPLLVGENGPALQEVQLADGLGNGVDSDAPSNIPFMPNGMTAWMQGVGSFASVGATNVAPGATSATGGFGLGLEKHLDADTRVGVMFGTTHESIDLNDVGQNGALMSYAVGLYGSKNVEDVTFDGSLLASYNHATSTRQVSLLDETAQGVSDGLGVGVDAGVSQRFALTDDTSLLPRLGFDYTYTNQGGYTETGAPGANLKIGTQTQSLFQSDLGATIDTRFELSDEDDVASDVIRPQFHAGWLHEWLNPAAQVQESFAGIASPSFTTYGANPGRDAAALAVGAGYIPGDSKDMTLYVNYGATIAPNSTAHTITGGIKINW